MRNKQKVLAKILKAVSSIVFIVLIGVLINGYSNHIGLFDTFEVKIITLYTSIIIIQFYIKI